MANGVVTEQDRGMSPQRDLLAHFREYFEVVRADTPALLEEAFRLRYDVYCAEGRVTGFPPERYPDRLEKDPYDEHSVHCLLRHRRTGACAGTVRLILADPRNPEWELPIEVWAAKSIDDSRFDPSRLHRHAVAELSRFILARRFRSRPGEWQWPDGLPDVEEVTERPDERRMLPHPILGIIKAFVLMSWERKINYLYAGMEPRLSRRFQRFGLLFQPISPLVDYHGPCRAYLATLPQMMQEIFVYYPDIWRLLTDDGTIWPVS